MAEQSAPSPQLKMHPRVETLFNTALIARSERMLTHMGKILPAKFNETKANRFLLKACKDVYPGLSEDLAVFLSAIQLSVAESLAAELTIMEFQDAGLIDNLTPISPALLRLRQSLDQFQQEPEPSDT